MWRRFSKKGTVANCQTKQMNKASDGSCLSCNGLTRFYPDQGDIDVLATDIKKTYIT